MRTGSMKPRWHSRFRHVLRVQAAKRALLRDVNTVLRCAPPSDLIVTDNSSSLLDNISLRYLRLVYSSSIQNLPIAHYITTASYISNLDLPLRIIESRYCLLPHHRLLPSPSTTTQRLLRFNLAKSTKTIKHLTNSSTASCSSQS